MKEQHGNGVIRHVSQMDFSKGIAKDKLLFIIICGAAIVMAALALWFGVLRPRSIPYISTDWECMECGNTFTKKTREFPPIECPDCKREEAALVVSQDCFKCGKNVPLYRSRLIESSREQVKAGKNKGAMTMPLEAQYWIEQPDGSYGWSGWIPMYITQAVEIRRSQKCPHCGESLFRKRR